MTKRVGFIGCGNMAQAMIGGIVQSGFIEPENLMTSNPTNEKLREIQQKYKVQITTSNLEVAAFSDVLILAVKPYMYKTVLEEIKDALKESAVIVSIAAGINTLLVEQSIGRAVKVVRTMPNTPALVGMGMTAMCRNRRIDDEEFAWVQRLFQSFGRTEVVGEHLMNAIPAVSGSSPAYVFMLIEALADGAVMDGIPRDQAYRMAAQAVLGSAKMVLESGKHPGELKDQVCSPRGSTIEAVYTLEKNNFRGAVMSAMRSCTEKVNLMEKES